MSYRNYTVTDEHGEWSVDVEADSAEWAAYLAAEKAWADWAWEFEGRPDFTLKCEGREFEIVVEFEPTFSPQEVDEQ